VANAGGLSEDGLRDLYRLMLTTRRLDQAAVALQRQGELTAFPPLAGQEAAQCASAYALEPDDFAFPSYREHGVAVARGVDLVAYLVSYRGHWNGGAYDIFEHNFGPIASSVGSHALHAVGWAMGSALDGRRAAAIAYFGDGATSEGDVHEAMNFAGVFRAPVVFFVQNNRWAISMPAERQTAGDIFARAAGYGFRGVRIDGDDAPAVYGATRQALGRARAGQGPTLIEAMTYRVGPHSTADDPSRYREPADAARAQTVDPLERMRRLLLAEQAADARWLAAVEREVERRIADIRAAVIASQPPSGDEMFEFVFARPPAELEAQRRWWRDAEEAGA